MHLACQAGHDQDGQDPELVPRLTEIVATLLEAKANVDAGDNRGQTALYVACILSRLDIVWLLLSYGARRKFPFAGPPYDTAEHYATHRGHHNIAAWLVRTRLWSTPLHHLEFLTPERTRTLLRAGDNIHAAAEPGGPTPISLARALAAEGRAAEGTAAFLVLEAAKPWSRK